MTARQSLAQRSLEDSFREFLELAFWLGIEVNHLWGDAFMFSKEARRIESDQGLSFVRKEQLLRASVLSSAAAFEASTNFLADRLIKLGGRMTDAERDFLQERKWELKDGSLKAHNCCRTSAKERFLLLFRLVTRGRDLGAEGRKELDTAFEIRNELAHPKPGRVFGVSEDSRAERALVGFFYAQLLLFRGFGKRFRKAFEDWRRLELAGQAVAEPSSESHPAVKRQVN
jgi:hypothetical protein